MNHCHILEHKDRGMMGQFLVDAGYNATEMALARRQNMGY